MLRYLLILVCGFAPVPAWPAKTAFHISFDQDESTSTGDHDRRTEISQRVRELLGEWSVKPRLVGDWAVVFINANSPYLTQGSELSADTLAFRSIDEDGVPILYIVWDRMLAMTDAPLMVTFTAVSAFVFTTHVLGIDSDAHPELNLAVSAYAVRSALRDIYRSPLHNSLGRADRDLLDSELEGAEQHAAKFFSPAEVRALECSLKLESTIH